MHCEVTDDSGFLALVDPDAYESFVTLDWELDVLFSHFRAQMRLGRLLLWGTGLEHAWPVLVTVGKKPIAGRAFRERSGPIFASRGRLLVTNYESLTMAASYADEHLPQRHEVEQVVALPVGLYRCTVRQLCDPSSEEAFERDPGFELLLTAGGGPAKAWARPAWSPL